MEVALTSLSEFGTKANMNLYTRAPSTRHGAQSISAVDQGKSPSLQARPRSIRPGPLAHAFDRLSLHAVVARFAFPRRFDRAHHQLLTNGGGAISPKQAAAHFGSGLFLEISPSTLTHRLEEKFFDGDSRRWIGEYFLDAGDWRNILSPLDDSPAHQEIVEICRWRQNFRECPLYRKYLARLTKGTPRRRNGRYLDSIEKIDGYFQYYLDLIESIERSGILPRNRFQKLKDTGENHRATRSLWHDMVERDIGVAIAADGSLVRHTSGKHRLAAAIGLGLDRIPVEIRMVHADWLQGEMQKLDLPPSQALWTSLRQAHFGR